MRRRGVSLVELLITLATLAAALGMVAALAHEYARLTTSTRGRFQRSLHLAALEQMTAELAGAFAVSVPAAGLEADFCRFQVIDRPVPVAPVAPGWDPRTPLVEVDYRLAGGCLRRSGVVLVREVAGLTVRRTTGGRLDVVLSHLEGERLLVRTASVKPWR